MYRKAGIASIKSKSLAQSKYKEKGDELAENQITTISRQFDQVRHSLELFASKHGNKIKEDSQLRSQFQAMCSSIGVDPIAYSRGCWSETLGLGEFYYHLGVKIIEVCMAHEKHTGGIMPLRELVSLLNKNRTQYESEVSTEDVKRSIRKLRCLGTGFSLISLPGGRLLVQSVPGEMNMDQTLVLGLAESSDSHVTTTAVMEKFNWTKDRADAVFRHLIQEGIAWVDNLDPCGERVFWFPSLMDSTITS
ncbi:Vacuolar-sorting protein isoform 2 [Schistosoma japonicum]|uniref:Vacuolar-sorting protein SNF8 n=1 Tax=Schistosoma japonicum TaxID=6182 RepID=A0A4Z2DUR8_SCHJA|nr:Vacuolar-sorting protein SNF8 [Schistosoma japonicum]KAH8867360.1 Vacuolar-sorting protein SNF8 [Schistosoma japonicum]KAH8867361.1 Vacuolar-sorting protein SNF8 [Schistosoma japonicum]KAH8867362.1 Vacuolar-sorting protein SNF8 [Schistosoma japonicum]KAH8867363.1 Vacuolar-sorting protein SNF8 [Schistosoma japonicum]